MNVTPRGEATHSGPKWNKTKICAEKQFAALTAGSSCSISESHGAWVQGDEMKNQAEIQNGKTESNSNMGAFAFLAAGLGIGAAVSVLLAPRSGADTRQWITTKCLDGVDAANAKVREARARVHEIVDQGQQKVGEAVNARREAATRAKPSATVS